MEEYKKILENLHQRLQFLKGEIVTFNKQKEAIENAIIGFGGSLEIIPSEKESPFSDYPISSTIKSKILYTLSKINEGTTHDIVKFMSEQENKDEKEFFSTVTMVASSMYNTEKTLDARKDGVKNIYSIKKKEDEVHNSTI